MRFMTRRLPGIAFAAVSVAVVGAQQAQKPPGGQGDRIGPVVTQLDAPPDDVRTLVGRLDLEKYKATIKGLTQFGDRREGTERNRKAVDWIEAQLKSYGCPTERLKYEYNPQPQGGGAGR